MVDPALWELAESGSPVEQVAIIVRLEQGAAPPAGVRVVATFGTIFTGRVARGDIMKVRRAPGVLSVKAGQPVILPSPLEASDQAPGDEAINEPDDAEASQTAPIDPTAIGDGRGVVVGVCDWGIDFTHANFRNADGTTRLLCALGSARRRVIRWRRRRTTTDGCSRARRSTPRWREPDPCAALGYHPASGDPGDAGSHGTHVADILAGNRREPGSAGRPRDRIGHRLRPPRRAAAVGTRQPRRLGRACSKAWTSFAGRRPAVRACCTSAPARPADRIAATRCSSAPSTRCCRRRASSWCRASATTRDAAMHAHARVGPDQQHVLDWMTPPNDRTPNELEIWYSGEDVFDVTLIAPDGREFPVPLDDRTQLRDGAEVWGNLYHRLHEPNSGLNHIVVYLYTAAPSGRWRVTLRGREVVDGRLHAWIERDASGRYQSRFPRSQASSRYTTNTICNCFRAIAVGAYDGTPPDRPPTRFSSRGPTADGRQKPEIAAPGYRIRAARSMPRRRLARRVASSCVKSGTSMAAPWVSGTVALMMAAAGRPLTISRDPSRPDRIGRSASGAVGPHLHAARLRLSQHRGGGRGGAPHRQRASGRSTRAGCARRPIRASAGRILRVGRADGDGGRRAGAGERRRRSS